MLRSWMLIHRVRAKKRAKSFSPSFRNSRPQPSAPTLRTSQWALGAPINRSTGFPGTGNGVSEGGFHLGDGDCSSLRFPSRSRQHLLPPTWHLPILPLRLSLLSAVQLPCCACLLTWHATLCPDCLMAMPRAASPKRSLEGFLGSRAENALHRPGEANPHGPPWRVWPISFQHEVGTIQDFSPLLRRCRVQAMP